MATGRDKFNCANRCEDVNSCYHGRCSNCQSYEPIHKSYWIDGYFDRFWNQTKVWYCQKRDTFVPKAVTVRNDQENDRIYITENYAKSILRPDRVFDMSKMSDMYAYAMSKKINVPWKKEVSKPLFKVSLP